MFDYHGKGGNVSNHDSKEVANTFLVCFRFLPSLRSETATVRASFFEDDGTLYVDSLVHVEQNAAIKVPPYLAAVDLRNFLIMLMPNALSIQPVNRLA